MGCGFSKESTICRNLSRLFSRHPTRQNDERSAEGDGPKANRVSLSSRHSPCRSSCEFGREQPGFADLSQPIPPEDLGGNPTQQDQNFPGAGEQQGRSGLHGSRRPTLPVDTGLAQQSPRRTSLQPTAGSHIPMRVESPACASPIRAHYAENIVQELETLRSLVHRYVNKHFGQASEVERRKICLRFYRLVIDYVQDNTSSRTRRCLLDQRRLLCVG